METFVCLCSVCGVGGTATEMVTTVTEKSIAIVDKRLKHKTCLICFRFLTAVGQNSSCY